MDPCVVYTCLTLMKRRKRRRWSVHPLNAMRHLRGAFYTLYEELRNHEEKFSNYFRMSVSSFDELSVKVRNTLAFRPQLVQGLCFQPEEMMAVTIRYLNSGCTYTELHYAYRMGITTVSLIVKSMCHVIWVTINEDMFLSLDCDQTVWRGVANGFMTRSNFPHCVGAIDGKQVRLINPAHSGSLYFNYKNYFSVVLLSVCDSNYKFLYIDVGSFGREGDSTVLRCSNFGKKLEEGTLNLPPPEKLSDNLMPLPYVFIGDEAFGISTNLMRAYAGSNLSVPKRIFNYRLCRARRYVECSFGILSNKWRIFHRPLNVDVKMAISVIKTCCALHNFVRDRDGVRLEDTLDVTGLYDIYTEDGGYDNLAQLRTRPRGPKKAYKYRDAFAEYFNSPVGSVPSQNSYM